MNNTAKKLKQSIKTLVEKKIRMTRERVEFKRKASTEFKQSPEYRDWFIDFDEIRGDIKFDIRHHLLAYALVRGRPYKTVERKVGPDNWPYVPAIERVLEHHKNFEDLEEMERVEKLTNGIDEWLKTPLEPQKEAA